jgi:hypothetical protein
MTDWSQVKPARWLPWGDEGLVMVGYRVVGIKGQLLYIPWVQHSVCSAWYPVGGDCLFCQINSQRL